MKIRKGLARKRIFPLSKNLKASLFYVFLVLLPGMLLAFFAISSFEKEESLLEKRFRETVNAEVHLLSRQVLSFLEETERKLQEELERIPPGREKDLFPQWQKSDSLVDIPFLLDTRLALVLPQPARQEEPRIQAFASWGESFFEGTPSSGSLERILLAWREIFAHPEFLSSEGIQGSPFAPSLPEAESPPPPVSPKEDDSLQNLHSAASFSLNRRSAKIPETRSFPATEKDTPPSTPLGGEASSGTEEIQKDRKDSPHKNGGESSSFFRQPYAFPEQIQGKNFGLLPYMMDNRIIFLFWARRGEEIGGCLLREDLLKKELGKSLARSRPERRESCFLAVLDEHGMPIYPWESERRALFSGTSPYESLEIGPLLPYWKCAAFLSPSHSMFSQAARSRFRHLLIIGGLLFSLSGGSFLLFRALRLEMHTAERKTTFVAKISHELKTPLTSLRLFAEMLEEGRIREEEKRHRYLRLMVSEIERLTRLIENILDFSRRERGLKRYSMKKTDLRNLITAIVEAQRLRLEQRGFSLLLKAPESPEVTADEEGIAQILLNLLTNAEKYSEDRREIQVILGMDESFAWVDVMDRGIGIAPEEGEKIFREFYRTDDSLTSKTQGAGLGLSISRNIARDHRGDLRFFPREGGGSVFRLLLPRSEEISRFREEDA